MPHQNRTLLFKIQRLQLHLKDKAIILTQGVSLKIQSLQAGLKINQHQRKQSFWTNLAQRSQWQNINHLFQRAKFKKFFISIRGKFLNGKIMNGKFQFANGFIYEGGYMFDKFFGEGVLKFPDGKEISGDWNGEKVIGNGSIKYPAGQIYYGQIQNLKKHGFGYLFTTDGSKFVGSFKQGKISGEGSYFKDQILVGEGFWDKGKLVQTQNIQTYTSKQLNTNKQSQNSKFSPEKVYSPQFLEYTLNSNSNEKNIQIDKKKQRAIPSIRVIGKQIDEFLGYDSSF